jgi:hypothetical protein
MVPCGEIMVVDTNKPPSAAESAFLAALLTACCRPSLWLAPGVLIVAPEVSGAGSGKGLLVRAISQIAFGCLLSAFTSGHDQQELDKRLVAALIEASQAVSSWTISTRRRCGPTHWRACSRSDQPICASWDAR